MKLFYPIILALLFITGACTEVIDVKVPEAPPRLVIEASIDWTKGTSGNQQTIKLSLSTPFFENLSTFPVTDAQVKVVNDEDQTEFYFDHVDEGIYSTDQFIPVMGQSYTLEVLYDGETYQAKETMTSVSSIKSVYQSTENGFDRNALEVNITFDDPEDEVNFYLAKFQRRGDLLPTYFDLKDEFTNGNEMSIFYEKISNEDDGEREFEPGDIVDIELIGITEGYFNYIRLLINQANPGGPFSSIPAEIKGNCVNLTDPDNYAYGFFRLTEVDKEVYIFE